MLRRFLLWLIFLTYGCAHSLDAWTQRQINCNAACIRLAGMFGKNAQTGYPLDVGQCGCQFDDGSVLTTGEHHE